MSVTVSVRKDRTGVWATGYDKVIPNNVRILEYVQLTTQSPATVQMVLKVEHPTTGILYIAETPESLAAKINGVNCIACGSGGGGGGADAKWATFTGLGAGGTYTLPSSPQAGSVKMFYTGVLRHDDPFTVAGAVVTPTITIPVGDDVTFFYEDDATSRSSW